MRRNPAHTLRWLPIAVLLAAAPAALGSEPVQRTVRVDGVGRAELVSGPAAEPVFLVDGPGGERRAMSPDAFAAWLADPDADDGAGWLYRALNISGPFGAAWVALGLLGQAVFMGRMLVQWIASERAKRSVVPVAFWWMSLVGATMLLAYFIWRRDAVGLLGQGTGWVIYARNLVLLRRPPAPPA